MKEKSSSGDVISRYLESKGHKQIEVHKTEPTIEDCFMELMK